LSSKGHSDLRCLREHHRNVRYSAGQDIDLTKCEPRKREQKRHTSPARLRRQGNKKLTRVPSRGCRHALILIEEVDKSKEVPENPPSSPGHLLPNQLRVMVETLSIGAVHIDRSGGPADPPVYCNRAVEELLGYGQNEMQTLSALFELIHREEAAEQRKKYEEVRERVSAYRSYLLEGFVPLIPVCCLMNLDCLNTAPEKIMKESGYARWMCTLSEISDFFEFCFFCSFGASSRKPAKSVEWKEKRVTVHVARKPLYLTIIHVVRRLRVEREIQILCEHVSSIS
jgi:PAS domain-containing protein